MAETPEEGNHNELDLHFIESEPEMALMEELKKLPCKSWKPYQSLKNGKEFKSFLQKNLDIFAWKHEDMVEIDSKDSYHHLNIDLSNAPYRQKKRASTHRSMKHSMRSQKVN